MASWNSLAASQHKHAHVYARTTPEITNDKITLCGVVQPKACASTYVCDSQSLDASNDGVEGSLNIGSRAGGHNGLGLFMEQLSYVLHRNT